MSAYLTPASGTEHLDKQSDIKSPLVRLKDSLSVVCKVNQSINQFRKNLDKPSLTSKFGKLGEKTE